MLMQHQRGGAIRWRAFRHFARRLAVSLSPAAQLVPLRTSHQGIQSFFRARSFSYPSQLGGWLFQWCHHLTHPFSLASPGTPLCHRKSTRTLLYCQWSGCWDERERTCSPSPVCRGRPKFDGDSFERESGAYDSQKGLRHQSPICTSGGEGGLTRGHSSCRSSWLMTWIFVGLQKLTEEHNNLSGFGGWHTSCIKSCSTDDHECRGPRVRW